MDILKILIENGHRFATGVPDSTLKSLCFELSSTDGIHHVPAASEGSAIALALGYWTSSGSIPVVYMQNSGLPNALNPLLSLASSAAFDIPLTLVIGWRGKPGHVDEPQHRLVGSSTLNLLKLADVYPIVVEATHSFDRLNAEYQDALLNHRRIGLIISPDVKLSNKVEGQSGSSAGIRKNELLQHVLNNSPEHSVLVGGIGHTSRQLLALRISRDQPESFDLHAVGGMGFASSLAAGIGLGAPNSKVICLDGDGSFLMHGTSVSSFARLPKAGLIHIVFANGVHASVGGHPLSNPSLDLASLAKSLGYRWAVSVNTLDEFQSAFQTASEMTHPTFIAAHISHEYPEALPRPKAHLSDALLEFRSYHFQEATVSRGDGHNGL